MRKTEAEKIGDKLGEIAVRVSEIPLDEEQIIRGILTTTDDVWRDALRRLGRVLLRAAERMDR